jgi:hypothetical protein
VLEVRADARPQVEALSGLLVDDGVVGAPHPALVGVDGVADFARVVAVSVAGRGYDHDSERHRRERHRRTGRKHQQNSANANRHESPLENIEINEFMRV